MDQRSLGSTLNFNIIYYDRSSIQNRQLKYKQKYHLSNMKGKAGQQLHHIHTKVIKTDKLGMRYK